MSNLYKRLYGLLPTTAQDVGEIIATHPDGVTVALASGAQIRVRGEGAIGERVFVQSGAVLGPAPALSGVDQEI